MYGVTYPLLLLKKLKSEIIVTYENVFDCKGGYISHSHTHSHTHARTCAHTQTQFLSQTALTVSKYERPIFQEFRTQNRTHAYLITVLFPIWVNVYALFFLR